MIELGDKVKCKISGFTGIATSRLTHINTCDQIGVKPDCGKDKTKMPETIWIDEMQLQIIKKGAVKQPKVFGKSGGENTIIKSAR